MGARGLKKGYKPTAAQLAQREKFKAMVQAKKKAPVQKSAEVVSEKVDKNSTYIFIALLGIAIIGGVAYWYFTKDKKSNGQSGSS